MKRKIILVLAVMIASILALALLVSCNPADTLSGIINENTFIYCSTKTAQTVTYKAVDLDSETLVTDKSGSFIFYQDADKNIVKAVAAINDKTVFDEEYVDGFTVDYLTVINKLPLIYTEKPNEVQGDEEPTKTVKIFDTYGTEVVSLILNVDKFFYMSEKSTYTDETNSTYVEYSLEYTDAEGIVVTNFYTFKKESTSLKYAPDFVGYVADEAGNALTTANVKKPLSKFRGLYSFNGYSFLYEEKYNNYAVEATKTSNNDTSIKIYNDKDKLKATTVIPQEYKFVCPIDNLKVLTRKTTNVVAGNKDYTYTSGGNATKVEYYTVNLLNGNIKSINLKYYIDGYSKYSYTTTTDDNNIETYSNFDNVVVWGRKIENKIVSSDRDYLVLNNNGTVKSNITKKMADLDIFNEGGVTKIAEGKYLINNSNYSFVANEELEKIFDIDFKIKEINIRNQKIVGCYDNEELDENLYGAIDFDGKIVTPFIYSYGTYYNYYPNSYVMKAINVNDNEIYIVDMYSNTVIAKLGSEVDKDGNESYTGVYFSEYVLFYYVNTIESFEYNDGEDTVTKYYVQSTLYSFSGDKIGTYCSKSASKAEYLYLTLNPGTFISTFASVEDSTNKIYYVKSVDEHDENNKTYSYFKVTVNKK